MRYLNLTSALWSHSQTCTIVTPGDTVEGFRGSNSVEGMKMF